MDRRLRLIISNLELGEAEAVNESVDLLTLFAKGTLVGRGSKIIAQVLGVKYRVDGVSRAFVAGSEYRANSCNCAVIVFDCLDRRVSGVSGYHAGGKDKHVFACYHRNDVVTENQLTSHNVLGGDHIDGLMSVKIQIVTVCKLLGNTGAYNLSIVKAEDGIYDSITAVIRNQLLGNGLSLGKTRLLDGDVDVVVYMAMAGREMSL